MTDGRFRKEEVAEALKVACELFASGATLMEFMPRFDRDGEEITNEFTYKACEVLGEVSVMDIGPRSVVEIRLSVEHGEDGYWVEARVKRL